MRQYRFTLVSIVLLAVIIRVAASLALDDTLRGLPGTADQLSYHLLAQRLLGGEGFSFDRTWWPLTGAGEPTAHWSFAYTYFLAGIYGLLGPNPVAARIIQGTVVGIAWPILAFLVGRRLFGPRVGLVAAGLSAIYAYFVYYSATIMTEPFYITAILAILYTAVLLVDRMKESSCSSSAVYLHAIALGLILGGALLLRQVLVLFVPLLLLWIWWASGRRFVFAAVIPGAVALLMLLPFTVYNYERFDRFVLLNTNAGYAFFWANHPVHGASFEPILPAELATYQDLIPEEIRHLDEAALDQELLRRGLQFVADDPLRYLKLSISRVPAYFMFWPTMSSSLLSNIGRTLSFGIFLPFMVFGLSRAWIEGGKAALSGPLGLLTLFIGTYAAIHLLSWALIRYRLPIDAVLIVFAAFALVELAQRVGFARELATQPA